MRPNLEDKYGFLELQDKILEIMVDIDHFCANNHIEYCLMGGSALGAARHGGFIPWDDDLDIFMTPDNYEKFRDFFQKNGNKDKYYLQEWGATNGMVTTVKIRLNNSTYIEEPIKNWDVHHGVFIDIFILHSCPNNKLAQLNQFFWGKYVITKGNALRENGRHSGFRGFVIKIAQLLPDRFLVKYALKQVYKYRNKQTDYYCNFLGKAVFKKAIYKRKWFDSPVYVPFETVQLKVPGKLHEFLSERFGDYMKIPSVESIKYGQHAEYWDLNNQLKYSDEYKDEIKLI